ncbi:hypothetical protein FQA39_LY18244 [Lamprigera yunnana]|nr:hypothetical protein FQA39_LY18244 [Lamprigera yunnana]
MDIRFDDTKEKGIIGDSSKGKTETMGFLRNYWGTKEQSEIKDELYGGGFNRKARITRERYALRKIYLFQQLEHFNELGMIVDWESRIVKWDKYEAMLQRLDDLQTDEKESEVNINNMGAHDKEKMKKLLK